MKPLKAKKVLPGVGNPIFYIFIYLPALVWVSTFGVETPSSPDYGYERRAVCVLADSVGSFMDLHLDNFPLCINGFFYLQAYAQDISSINLYVILFP